MKHVVLGPTREMEVAEPAAMVTARLAAWVDSGACAFQAIHRGGCFQCAMPRERRRFWSAWMTLDVRAAEDPGRCTVFARFNPSPSIWTGYMLASLALVTLSAGAAMWAAAQWTMGRPMAALWVIPACAAVLVVMWGVSAAGQRLAWEEIGEMWGAVEGVAMGNGQSAMGG